MKKAFTLLVACLASQLTFAQFSVQKVLIEEHTGAWCGYCPDGAVILGNILDGQENAIGAAVHNGDAMTIPDGDELGTFYIAGYPQATINRTGAGISRGSWASTTNNQLSGASIVTVAFDSISYNASTRQVTAYVKATFTGTATGDLRFNLIVTEDNVTGTGSGYNQSNYYDATAGHTYYGAGNPIMGFNHRHVVRAYLGGAWGDAGIIPASVSFGTSATHTYTYTLPASVDENEVHLIAFVGRFDGPGTSDREVLNAEEIQLLTPTSISNPQLNAGNLQVFPNPMSDRTTLQFDLQKNANLRVEILNPLGQHVHTIAEGFMNSGTHSLYWIGRDDNGSPVPNGIYFVRITTDAGEVLTQRISVQR